MFRPHDSLSQNQIRSGLRWLYAEGIAALGLNSIITSGFLTSFALLLGANAFQVGYLSAAPFIFQPLQLLFVPLTDAWRQRKLVSMLVGPLIFLLWIPVALLPFIDLAPSQRVAFLLVLASLQGILRSLFAVNWQSWLRDLIPGPIMGSVFAKRMVFGSIAAIVFSLSGSLFVDYWRTADTTRDELQGYTLVLICGVATLGIMRPLCMAHIPEIRMFRAAMPHQSLFLSLVMPFRDPSFRRLLIFLFVRTFYVTLATPFFAVYMLQQLAYPLSVVIVFTALSQVANAWILPLWGNYVDRFGGKAIMLASGSLMMLVLPVWSLLASVDRGTVSSGYLVYFIIAFCMILLGISTAGADIATSIMIMKRAKQHNSNAYLSTASIAGSLGAGVGPLVGGRLIDVLLQRQLTIHVTWSGPIASQAFTGLHLGGYEFLFQLAFLLGLLASNLLAHIHEDKNYTRAVVVDALFRNSTDMVRAMNVIPGVRFLQAPLDFVRHIPGMDTVLGLTLYQFSNAIRLAVATSHVSTKSAWTLALAVKINLARVLQGKDNLEAHAEEIAYHAARGATHAIWELDTDPHLIIQGSLLGIAQELGERMDSKGSRRALRGIVRGVIRGAHETRQDLNALIPAIYTASLDAAGRMAIHPVQADRIVRGAMLYTATRIGRRAARTVHQQLNKMKHPQTPHTP